MTTMEISGDLPAALAPLAAICVVSYAAAALLIPVVAQRMPGKLTGKDLCKRGTPAGDIPMYVMLLWVVMHSDQRLTFLVALSCSPEALGIVSGLVYVVALLVTVFTIVDNADVKVSTLSSWMFDSQNLTPGRCSVANDALGHCLHPLYDRVGLL
jgi:hypothetical protein